MVILQAVAKYWGIHPALLPERHHAVFHRAGIDPADLRRTLRSIHSMDEWPLVWRAEAERHLAQGRDLAGFLCMYIAQRVIIDPFDLKRELYERSAQLYTDLPHRRPIGRISFDHEGHMIAALVQEPRLSGERRCRGTIVLVPGVTFAKEELHFAAETFAERGWRVVRIDNPAYGQTPGTLQQIGIGYIHSVADQVRERYASPVMGIGFSLGGYLLLRNARAFDRVVTIGAPCEPDRYVAELPDHSRRALGHMIGEHDRQRLRAMLAHNRLQRAELGTTPLLLVHGGRDRTVPVSEMACIAAKAQGPVVPMTYPSESHGCRGSLEDIWAQCLEWFDVEPTDRKPLHAMQVEPTALQQAVQLASHAGARMRQSARQLTLRTVQVAGSVRNAVALR
jgi:pimeloyl-ACP methyl ester carboxylesterase